MTEEQIRIFIISQFPIASLLIWGLKQKWWYLGSTVTDIITSMKEERERDDNDHEKVLAEKDKQIIFHDQLRLETIEDKKRLEERATKSREAVEELTHVVRESIDLTGEVIRRIDTSGSVRRPRSTKNATRTPRRARKDGGST